MSEPNQTSQPDEPVAAPNGLPPIVVLNPTGNRGRAARLRKPLARALAGGRGELVLTWTTEEAEARVTAAARAGRGVVAVGGDGTVAVIANALMAAGAPVPLGIVPAGTGNDYAYETLHLPRELLAALEVALTGVPVPMDVGQVNGRYFFNSLGVGIDANIAAAANELKRLRFLNGQALYYASSLRELIFHYQRCPALRVTIDDQPDESRLYALVAVSLGPTYGGGFHINPGADPHDGLFDVCSIWKPSQLRALQLLPMVEKGAHLAQREVKRARARTVSLESAKPIYAHLDGEVITASSFEARILPGALRVRQPSV
ncbi:MAG TPA: diacylglycerol kinase family protein [Ktedonobacterales bacterium]|jgi:diacylglycerol kinase (ATP)|nr:diacylglycerol kinase family protein [Ktedonobacterales bacterium]